MQILTFGEYSETTTVDIENQKEIFAKTLPVVPIDFDPWQRIDHAILLAQHARLIFSMGICAVNGECEARFMDYDGVWYGKSLSPAEAVTKAFLKAASKCYWWRKKRGLAVPGWYK